jgi:RimJ/RimL family protein N-acetyltransferase
VRHGFKNPRLPGFSSAHFIDNPASAGVLRKLGFAPTGETRIACAARGRDIAAVTYWLDREEARRTLPMAEANDEPPSRWRVWFGRLGAT